ncbi:class I SAM-dependent methyltransferase [Altericista sp. CCNU0014]|uniref:class I SAM-dependent methyltransferase n=1 Tax=Altericista sp. CCNU0014 TaxID=3082949 RepID=UPI00384C5391
MIMNSEFLRNWEDDARSISSRYFEKITKEGLGSAKSLGQRTDRKDFLFHEHLFQNIELSLPCSFLDIGCGKADLLKFLNDAYPNCAIQRYLGIDIVPEFIQFSRRAYPAFEFQLSNFISEQFAPDKKFDIVLALGVLVSRVRNYQDYIRAFVEKMTSVSSHAVLFNLITEVDPDSPHYMHSLEIGHSTYLPLEELGCILASLQCSQCQLYQEHLFPDATDTFVQIFV